ncbi:seizure protein 6 homolog isoform X2 [Ptychodera flava]
MGNVQGVPDIGLYGNNATPIENVADTKGNKLWVSLEALDLIDSDGIEPCGFEMEFRSKLAATEEYVTSYNGSVFSPMYPFPYPTNITYTTKISTPEGTVVTLGFTELQLRRGDNVSVYDDGAKLIVAYVHGDDPGMETIIVRSNVSYVVLYSGIGDNTTNGSYSLGFEALRVCLATDNEGNGDIYPEEDYYLPGEVVTVVCHIGFESSTNYTNITCEEGGRWDTEMPVCAIVVCGDPGQPDNGVRIGDEFSYGDTVAYQCNEGYTLNGTDAITCQSTGTWDGEAPTCQIVSCGDPGEVENGDPVGDDFTYGKNITYHCHEGYTVNGTETITCQSNGQWSEAAPVCALVTEIGDTSLTAVTVTVSMALFVMIILIVIAAIVLYRRSITAKPKTSEVNDLPNVTYELTTSGVNGAEQKKGSTTLNNTKNNQRVKTSNYIHTYENAGLEVHDDLRKSKCLGNINISESSTDDITMELTKAMAI